MKYSLKNKSANENNPCWDKLICREKPLNIKTDELRGEFMRDYTRILHSDAYRRLRHKTQVFFNPKNDHICTRMEHVQHVESVSYTIAENLGLNTTLTKAIATGHDLGHAPFGHSGEHIISKIAKDNGLTDFWHEKNGLHYVDSIEFLPDDNGEYRNLNLTYAVRDGIICHCGEVDNNGIIPRREFIDLNTINSVGEVEPITYEGAVVKIADKIAYVGRDIEDADRLGVLDNKAKEELKKISSDLGGTVNTAKIMHKLIVDIIENSNECVGVKFSNECNNLLKNIKDFNYKYIYRSGMLESYQNYATLIFNEVFNHFKKFYDGEKTLNNLYNSVRYNNINKELYKFLVEHTVFDKNKPLIKKPYNELESEQIYIRAVLDYISGMTDGYLIKTFEQIITF